MVRITRRDVARLFVGGAAAHSLRGDGMLVSGLDHLKVRVADSEISALFYHRLFGREVVSLWNSTLPGSPLVKEFFLKLGPAPYPYLMLSQVRDGEMAGLDHLSLLASDPAAARSVLQRNGVALLHPDQGLWFRDPAGALLELMGGATWEHLGPSGRLPLPPDFQERRPAFEAVAITRLSLRTPDFSESARFYGQLFSQPIASGRAAFALGSTVLQLKPASRAQTSGLDRMTISVRNLRVTEARRILQSRGIHAYGSRSEVLFRDPDGNELELVAG